MEQPRRFRMRRNRGLGQTMKTFGGSMEGAAIGDLLREFITGTALMARLKHLD